MKHIPTVAAILLGLVFVVFGLNYFLQFLPMPELPNDSPAGMFMGALFSTGYLGLVKVLEVTGGVLVALPKTRAIGLLVLGPIIVNILAFHWFMLGGAGLVGPPLLVAVLALFVLCSKRAAFWAQITK